MYKTLVLSGGGVKGFGMLGILARLVEEKKLVIGDLTTCIGSSVGGVICCLISLNQFPLDIVIRIIQFLPLNFAKEKKRVLDFLEFFVKELSFEELFQKTNKNLILTTYNISERKAIYYNYKTHPKKKVLEALNETITIPYFMDQSHSQVDGCLCSPFPIKYCKDNQMTNIIGIYCISSYNNILGIPNPYDHIKTCILELLNKITEYETYFADKKEDLIVEFDLKTPFEVFQIDYTTAERLFFLGLMKEINEAEHNHAIT